MFVAPRVSAFWISDPRDAGYWNPRDFSAVATALSRFSQASPQIKKNLLALKRDSAAGYADLQAIQLSFRRLIRIVPRSGLIIAGTVTGATGGTIKVGGQIAAHILSNAKPINDMKVRAQALCYV